MQELKILDVTEMRGKKEGDRDILLISIVGAALGWLTVSTGPTGDAVIGVVGYLALIGYIIRTQKRKV